MIVQGRPFTFELSGNRTFTSNFISTLTRKLQDYQFEILIPKEVNEREFNLPSNVSFHFLPIDGYSSDPQLISKWENETVYNYVTEQKDAAFFLSTHHSLPLKKLPIKEYSIIHDIHLWKEIDQGWSIQRKEAYKINKQSMYNADIVFTVSDFSNKEIKDFFSFKNTPVVSIYEDVNPYYKQDHPVNEDLLKNTFSVTPQSYFLYLGSFEKRKRVEMLLEAYETYRSRVQNPKKLLIVGAHTPRSKEVVHLEFGEGIIHFEAAPLNQLYLLYQNAFAFVYPSVYEGFGLQILEAQNAGCPVIASDINIFREVGENTLLYFENNVSDLVHKIIHLEENVSYRADLIKKGKQNTKRYSWERTVDIFTRTLHL